MISLLFGIEDIKAINSWSVPKDAPLPKDKNVHGRYNESIPDIGNTLSIFSFFPSPPHHVSMTPKDSFKRIKHPADYQLSRENEKQGKKRDEGKSWDRCDPLGN